MSILDKIINSGIVELSKKKEISYRIDNIILGKSIYTMKDCEKVFSDMNMCLVILEQGYGFAYFQDELNFQNIQEYVNGDIRNVLRMNIPLYFKIAIADAIYSVLNNLNNKSGFKKLKGNLRTKAKLRAKELIEDIKPGSNVILLGAVTEIIEECSNKKLQLSVLDLESSKIGLTFSQNTVGNSSKLFVKKIKGADYIIATGMIFVSNYADKIFEYANKNNCKLIMYMETGSNFGEKLIEFGAYRVLSEFFPYYDFSGETKYMMYKRNFPINSLYNLSFLSKYFPLVTVKLLPKLRKEIYNLKISTIFESAD